MASTVISAVLSTTTKFILTTSSPSDDNHKPKQNIVTAYYNSSGSSREFTIVGLSILLFGICVLSAVIMKFARAGSRETNHSIAVVQVRIPVLDQAAINRSFYVRVFPSHQRFLMNNDESSGTMTAVTVDNPSITQKDKAYQSTQDEKSIPQLPRRHSFVGLPSLGKLLSRDSLIYNSPCPSLNAAKTPSLYDRAIQALPILSAKSCDVKVHDDLDCSHLEKQEQKDELCSICLCEYEVEDHIRVLPCGHEYHVECIDIWLCSKSTQCPLCKRDLMNDISALN